MPKLSVVVASTRPNRVGLPVAHWFVAQAKAHGAFDVDLDPGGIFRGSEPLEKSATTMLGELVRWSGALKALRAPSSP
jgi:hypothetical protein